MGVSLLRSTMTGDKQMKTVRYAILLLLLAMSLNPLYAVEKGPFTLELGSWVCDTPEDYDKAVATQKEGSKSVMKLASEFFDQGICIYMDDENLEDMMAPYVKIIEQQGDRTKVSFFVDFYKRIAMLHRQIKQVKFVGWTDSKNIKKHRSAS
jgi:hypothetical protein